jgi:hypothetical protein
MAEIALDHSWFPLLKECFQLTTPPGQHELPLILVLAPSGGGKSAVLASIEQSISRPVTRRSVSDSAAARAIRW